MSRMVCILAALVALVTDASGQEPKQLYKVPTPKGWTTETIALPPGFAPGMKWKGTEEIRFAPGMFKADSDSFFSYTLLFWLPSDQKVDAKAIERELLVYYQGLCQAVSKGKNQQVDVSGFTVLLKDLANAKNGKRPSGEPVVAYTGELKWIEPFATGKPQTLHLDAQVWFCAKHKHHCIFLCVSPQPKSASVWKAMAEIRDATACH